MALDIPLPGSFGEAYRKGSETGSTILSRLMAAKQAQNELAETSKYHEGQLGIQKGELGVRQKQLDINSRHAAVAEAAEGRAQKLMPYLVQEYQDTHGKAASEAEMKGMYNKIIKYEYTNAYPTLFPGHAEEAHKAALDHLERQKAQSEAQSQQLQQPQQAPGQMPGNLPFTAQDDNTNLMQKMMANPNTAGEAP